MGQIIWLKIFPSLLFYVLVNNSLHTAHNVINLSTFQGYVLLSIVTTLGKLQIFLTISSNSKTSTWVLRRYVWNHCDQAVDMVWKAPFCWDCRMSVSFAIHKAALLKLETVQILFYLASIPIQFWWIWCRKLTMLCQSWAVFCLNWPV